MSGERVAKVGGSVGAFPAAQWDALNPDGNPFVSHAFLTALEDSGSVGEGTGWQPAPIVIEDGQGSLCAALPSYLKGHSQGEYVFDHSWADAFERAGGRYYPKLQIAAPFTPATGPRLLLTDEALAEPLLAAAQQLCTQNGFSSAHASFIEPAQQALFERAGWMLRHDIQYHWHNRDYDSFDHFLADLSSRKRKDLRKERAAAQRGVTIRRLRGGEIRLQRGPLQPAAVVLRREHREEERGADVEKALVVLPRPFLPPGARCCWVNHVFRFRCFRPQQRAERGP